MNESMKKLWQSVRAGASDLAESAADTVSCLGDKASALADITQLNISLAEKKNKVNRLLQEVGSMVYATHTGSPTDSDALLAKLAEIDDAKREVQEVQDKIDARRGIEKCVVCGKNLLPGDQFCRDCGAPR